VFGGECLDQLVGFDLEFSATFSLKELLTQRQRSRQNPSSRRGPDSPLLLLTSQAASQSPSRVKSSTLVVVDETGEVTMTARSRGFFVIVGILPTAFIPLVQPIQLCADQASWIRSINEGAKYRQEARYREAEKAFLNALEEAEDSPGQDLRLSVNLNNLALLYSDEGRYREAEPLYLRALELRERILGPDHPELALTLNNLGILYRSQALYAKADPLFQRALSILEKQYGPKHTEIAMVLNNLAVSRYEQGNNLATVYCYEKRYAEAEALSRRALAIWQKVLGPEHREVAAGLTNLAQTCYQQGRYQEAASLLQRSLAIREKVLGPDHPSIAETLKQYASALRKIKQKSEAAKMEARARDTHAHSSRASQTQHTVDVLALRPMGK
jgi:tetratricopeptide (TPR) repeat protein